MKKADKLDGLLDLNFIEAPSEGVQGDQRDQLAGSIATP
jgi:hypothetical protein